MAAETTKASQSCLRGLRRSLGRRVSGQTRRQTTSRGSASPTAAAIASCASGPRYRAIHATGTTSPSAVSVVVHHALSSMSAMSAMSSIAHRSWPSALSQDVL